MALHHVLLKTLHCEQEIVILLLIYNTFCHWDWLSWSEQGVDDAKAVGLISGWVVHLRAELHDPWGSLPTPNVL